MATEDPTAERWLPIQGYEGLYEVSDFGRVRKRDAKTGGWKIRSAGTVRGGYKQMVFCVNGKITYALVHRLVLSAFDRPPQRGEEANHLDFDRANNRRNNLQWCSKQENCSYSAAAERHSKKLRKADVLRMRELCAKGMKQSDVAELYGVTQGHVSEVCSRNRWKHVGHQK